MREDKEEKRAMPAAERILIVAPAFNEASRIAGVVEAAAKVLPEADFLVVDDGSRDGTAGAARQAGARVVSLPFNLGYGAALQTGFKYALRHGYDYVVQIDADGQHDAGGLAGLVKAIRKGDADVVIGSRFLGDTPFDAPLARQLGTALFRTIVSTVVGRRISDPTSGFQALNRDVIGLYATEAYPVDYPDADVLIMLHLNGYRIREIPVVMYSMENPKESMHSGFKPLYYLFKMFLSIMVTLMRQRVRRREGKN